MKKLLIPLFLLCSLATASFVIPDGAITTAKLNDAVFSGLTAVTAALDDYVVIADTSDSSKKKKALVSTIRDKKYRSVTTTDTAVIATDDVLILSGASFTQTLPTAVSNTGKVFTLIHNGTSLTQIYTLNTTSAQTIGGVASGSYKLYTAGETLSVVSDGTNWQIVSHVARTAPVVYSATFTNATPSAQNIWWARDGAFMVIGGTFTFASVAGAECRIPLPSSMVANSVITLQTESGLLSVNAAAGTAYMLSIESGASYLVFTSQASGTAKLNCSAFANATLASFFVRVPISGFQP